MEYQKVLISIFAVILAAAAVALFSVVSGSSTSVEAEPEIGPPLWVTSSTSTSSSTTVARATSSTSSTTLDPYAFNVTGANPPDQYPRMAVIAGITQPSTTVTALAEVAGKELSHAETLSTSEGTFLLELPFPTEASPVSVKVSSNGQTIPINVTNDLPIFAVDPLPETIVSTTLQVSGIAVPGSPIIVDTPYGWSSATAPANGLFVVVVELIEPQIGKKFSVIVSVDILDGPTPEIVKTTYQP